jgi:hypothetical protein
MIDPDRSTYRLPGPNRDGATVHVAIPKPATITSQTVATIPSNRARTRIGVGESVQLTFVPTGPNADMIASIGTWTADPDGKGTLSSTSGQTVTYTAPDRAASVTFTAKASGYSGSLTLTIVEPSAVALQRRPGTKGNHTVNTVSAGFIADVYIYPKDVSFENCSCLEGEAYAEGNGCCQQYFHDNRSGHSPSATPTPVGKPVNDTSGSKLSIFDGIDANWSTQCAGGWTYQIPWFFLVGSGAKKQFATVAETIVMTADGGMTITKGDHNHSGYGDQTDIDPLF